MKKILISTLFIFVLTACQTKYLTPEGERLAKNVAAGCVFGEIFLKTVKQVQQLQEQQPLLMGKTKNFS